MNTLTNLLQGSHSLRCFLTQNNLLHSNSDSLKLVLIEEREGGNDCQVLHEKGCHDLAPQVLFANVAWSGFKTSITALTFQWDQAKQFDKLCYYDRMLWNKYLKGTVKNKWCIGLAQIWLVKCNQAVNGHLSQLWRIFQLWITSNPRRRMVNRNGEIGLVRLRRRAEWVGRVNCEWPGGSGHTQLTLWSTNS